MRTKLIGCCSTKQEVLASAGAAQYDCDFLDFSFHAFPEQLHAELQQRIDASQDYDLIILTYGRCSHAVENLVSPRVPLILPNVHDCISLLLGSDLRRQDWGAGNPDAYYFSLGWLEYGRNPYDEYREYVQTYGEPVAQYLIQTLYGKYRQTLFIRTVEDAEKIAQCRRQVRQIAGFFDWKVRETAGDLTLLQALVAGKCGQGVVRVAPGRPVVLEEGNCYAD